MGYIPIQLSAGRAPRSNAVRAPLCIYRAPLFTFQCGLPIWRQRQGQFFTKIFPAPPKCLSSSPNHLQVGPTLPCLFVPIGRCMGLPTQSSRPNPQSCICLTAERADRSDAVSCSAALHVKFYIALLIQRTGGALPSDAVHCCSRRVSPPHNVSWCIPVGKPLPPDVGWLVGLQLTWVVSFIFAVGPEKKPN